MRGMLMKTTVFFDLDGTLVESGFGIRRGFAHALTSLGHPTEPDAVPEALIGPPLLEAFRDRYGLSEEEAHRGVALYRDFYPREAMLDSPPYPGVVAMLTALRLAGLRLAVATGKPHPYARRIVAHLGLDPFFEAVFGAEFDGTRGRKEDLLRYAMASLAVSPEEAVMVGDRSYDILGATAAGITPVGVLWGYGTCLELREAGATHLAADTAEATAILLSLCGRGVK